jgi:hypothetical protein
MLSNKQSFSFIITDIFKQNDKTSEIHWLKQLMISLIIIRNDYESNFLKHNHQSKH